MENIYFVIISQSTRLYQYSEAISLKFRAAYAAKLEGRAALPIRSGPKQVKQNSNIVAFIVE